MASARDELSSHLVLFCDFLGFRDTARKQDRMDKLLAALVEVAGFRSEYKKVTEVRPDGTTMTSYQAAVTAFSDNVVVSHELEPTNEEDVEVALLHMMLHASDLARVGFENGLLIRGGLALGKLYHKGGIVFGEGLISAYELEQRVANYPRIAVSSEVVHRLAGRESPALLYGYDGVYELNYLDDFYRAFVRKYQPEDKTRHKEEWWQSCQTEIVKHHGGLSGDHNLSAAAKWHWFKMQFDRRFGASRSEALELSY